MFPAFKEWRVVVEALAAGEQIILLRKGGIAEGRGGFDPARARRFWLFPTQFHAQREKTKPAAAHQFAAPADTADGLITLKAFAEVAHTAFLSDWPSVAALDPFHIWTEAAVREKFDWGRPPGLHVLVVRVHRLRKPVTFAATADMGGCKSWIELPYAFDEYPSDPALADVDWTTRRLGFGL